MKDVVEFYRRHKEYIDKWAQNEEGNVYLELVIYAQMIQEAVEEELRPLLEFVKSTRAPPASEEGG